MTGLIIRSIVAVILISWLGAQSDLETRYYLSEIDFLSDRPVPPDRAQSQAHFVVEYDRQDRVISKTEIDNFGIISQVSEFSYFKTDLKPEHEKIYLNDRLSRKIQFGSDSLSVLFIEYSWEQNAEIVWDDRHAVYDYNAAGQIDTCRFYDSGIDNFGRIIYSYDIQGRLIKEEWLNVDLSVRKWLHIFDDQARIKRTIETDANNQIVYDIRLHDDGRELAAKWSSPKAGKTINNTTVSFQLYTDLSDGEIIIKWLRGTQDLIGEYIYRLYGIEKKKGKQIIDLNLDDILSDGAIYQISLNGITFRNNSMIEVIVDSLKFDRTEPQSVLRVVPRSVHPHIAFTCTESIKSARLNYQVQDDAIPGTRKLSVPLTQDELLYATDSLFIPVNQIALDSNSYYQVTLEATDLAGNCGLSNTYTGFDFDGQPPVITLIKPVSNSFINNLNIQMMVDEPVYQISVSWNVIDSDTTHHFDIQPDSLLEPDSMFLVESADIVLIDSSFYSLEISAADMLGNLNELFIIDSLQADLTPPLITSIFPFDSATVEETSVSYIFSEKLGRAEYQWITYDYADTLIYRCPLEGEELTAGEKIHIQLRNFPDLTEMTNYQVILQGWDQAGNEGNRVVINNVFYGGPVELE